MQNRSSNRDPGQVPAPPQESIVQRIGRLYGAESRVMLHDRPGESGPLLPTKPQDETPVDDSQYQILGFIAKGGVGMVYKARDKNLGREVAFKVLRADRVGTTHVAERLIEEAQVGGQLQHPGVVPVYGLGLAKDGRPSFAMKLIKGTTFASLLQERADPRQNQPQLLAQFEQLCQTMAYSHSRGVIHRDLKPANIMVGAFGEVLVVDWGFGKVLGRDARGRNKQPAEDMPGPVSIIATLRSGADGTESIEGSIMGTPAYMPPEQALGQIDQLDERADVFALGAVLCEILTGQPPYVGDAGDMLVMAAQGKLDDAFARLDQCGADPVLIELAKECLAPVPGARPERAGVVAERLSSHFSGVEERAQRAKLEAAQAHAAAQEQRARLAAERLKAEKERAKATEERIKHERAHGAAEEQRRLSRWERHRQRRTIVLAALVLVALLVGGGSYVTITATKQEYSADQHATFSKAFAAATELATASRWSEAAASAEGTLTLLGPGQDEKRSYVRDAIRTWKAKQEADEAAASREAKDRLVLERLRELRSSTAVEFDPVATDDAYAATFREYGIDVEKLKPEPAGRAIRAAPNPVELAGALDAWVSLRRSDRALKNRDWHKLMSVAQVADPDPIRARIRRELVTGGSVALAHMASSKKIDSQSAHTLTQLATALLTMGDAAGAARLFRRARGRYPADVWVNLGLANALNSLRPPRPAEAARYVRAALAAQPQSDQIRWTLGAMLAGAREWGAAAETWRTLIRQSPDVPVLHGLLAEAQSRLGDLDGAQSAAARALELEPKAWLSWNALLDVSAIRADRESYLARCTEAKRVFPEDGTIVAHHARALARNGKHAPALAAAGEALKRDAGNALACVVMGTFLLERGNADRAVGVLQNGVDAANREFGFYSQARLAVLLERTFARALAKTGELDQSENTLVRRMQSNPRDVSALWGIAGVRRLQHRFPDELRVRRQIAQLDPYEPEAHKEIGDVLRDRQGRYAEAEASYRRALALRPETGRYHGALARALALQGKTDEALQACRRAEELDPFDFGIRADRVAVLVRAGRMNEARRAAREAADAAPELCAAQVAVGAAQLEAGDLEGATTSLERAVELGPQSSAAQLLLGRARWRRADLAGAAAILRTAVGQRPRDVQAWLDFATVLAAQGEEQEALRGFRRVQSLARRLAGGYSGEAWVRGRAAEEDLRRPTEVVPLARRAVDLDPRDGAGWRALALGHLLSGAAQAAGEACAQALETDLDAGAAAEVFFLRAMAEAKQGRAADARRFYEDGLARMKVAEGPSRDRDGLRREASQLVGVEED